jgi:hypothetical protein
MNKELQRSIEIADGIKSGALWVNPDLADEIAELLYALAGEVEAQPRCDRAVTLALTYYSEPHLYYVPVSGNNPILDGGLRARTAMRYLHGTCPRPQWRPIKKGVTV